MSGLDRRRVVQGLALLAALAPAAKGFAGLAGDAYATANGLGVRGRQLVDIATDIILPRTDTPGAHDVDVTGFIDRMLRDWASDAQRDRFVAGVAAFDADIVARTGQRLDTLVPAARIATIGAIDRAAYLVPAASPLPFIVALKTLTLAGYYTSEAGASKELELNLVPGAYFPCAHLAVATHADAILKSYKLVAFD
jgi:hypothetical protein